MHYSVLSFNHISTVLATIRFCLVTCFIVTPVHAHEYWLSPIDYHIRADKKLIVDIRNGQDFAGSAFPFDPARLQSLYLSINGEKRTISSRLGDYPAIQKIATEPGHYIVVIESTERMLTYATWDKITDFLNYRGLDAYANKHTAMKLPKVDIKEQYYRYAKSLVTVSPQSDRVYTEVDGDIDTVLESQGQEFEIVLMDNPYAAKDNTRIKLLFQGEPVPDRQVEVFHNDKSVTRTTTRTDANGSTTIDLSKKGEYMINFVMLLPPERRDMHLKSAWSSCTFELM